MYVPSLESVRDDFPFVKQVVYFDSASVCPCPISVIEEMSRFYLTNPYNCGVGVFSGSANVKSKVDKARAVGYLNTLGVENVQKRISELTDLLANGLKSIRGLSTLGCEDTIHNAGILSWTFRDSSPDSIAIGLFDRHQIAVASGTQGSYFALKPYGVNGVVRTSVHIFNTEEDINKLVEAVREIKSI